MKTTLRATKTLRYGTRRLLPGDEFEASSRDARILLGMRNSKVEAVTAALEFTPHIDRLERFSSAPVQTQDYPTEGRDTDDTTFKSGNALLDQLRAEASELGLAVDGRWGPHRLRSEIDAKRRMAE